MDFSPSPTQALVQQTARDFASRRLRPVAAQLDREGRFPAEIIREMAELGLMGVNIPAALGGSEAGAVSYALAMMEIASACASTAVTMAVTNMVAEVICAFGTEEQKQKYVPRLCSGEAIAGAFALSEPQAAATSDRASIETTAPLVLRFILFSSPDTDGLPVRPGGPGGAHAPSRPRADAAPFGDATVSNTMASR